MVGLKQIARAVGVDISVASRALNPKPDVNARVAPATRIKIHNYARRMNYRPNRAAEFLKRGQAPSIGAFLPVFAPDLSMGLAIGIAETAAAEGFPVQFHFDRSPEEYRRFLKNIPTLSHCGLITYPYNVQSKATDRLIKRFQAARGKLVAIHYHLNLQGVCTVAIDDMEGGRIAARRLLERGCRTFIGYNRACIAAHARNWRGYRATGFIEMLRDSGVSPALFDTTPDARQEICRICGNTRPGTTGIFCASDRDAIHLMNELQAAGLKVGKDVLVIGYDNLYLTADISPALTTLHQPMREIGALAAHKVIRLIYGKKEKSELIPPNLIIRESA